MKNFEPQLEKRETNKPASIRLEFFRHDDKEGDSIANPDDNIDRAIALSAAGREHSSKVGADKNPLPEMAIAYGSPRNRTIETSLRQLLANEAEISPNLSLEDINRIIGKNLPVGKKYQKTELLDFNYNGGPEFRNIAKERFKNSQDLLVWHLEESDSLVEKSKDKISTSYSRLAGNVAELVLKYFTSYDQWKKIIKEDPKKYSEFNNELQRFMGTHQGVGESFLMKVIEKTLGKDAVYDFIDSLESKNGFQFGEGYSLVIEDAKDNSAAPSKKITINFKNQQYTCSEKELKEIIQDRDNLNNPKTI